MALEATVSTDKKIFFGDKLMLNRPKLLALFAIALFGSAVAINQWSHYFADSKAVLSADESAVLADKLLKSRMTYGAVDQSVLKVDPAQQLTLQARVDNISASSARASVRGAAGSSVVPSTKLNTAAVAGDVLAETLTSEEVRL